LYPSVTLAAEAACRCEGRRGGLLPPFWSPRGDRKKSAFRGFFAARLQNVFLALLEKGLCPTGAPFPASKIALGAECLVSLNA